MESISRVSGLIGNTRDLTLDAARDLLVQRKSSAPAHVTPQQLRNALDSRHEREVLQGLRQLISYSQQNRKIEAAQFLPIALKSISSPNPNIRKLVYIYLLENAESDPDTALLSINSIQKALSAPDPQLRALALRTMSSLKVPVIAQIVSLGIRKGAADMSPIVRRTAALAIPKCWRLDPNTIPQLEKYLGQLLGDRQYHVVSAALLAYDECCPESIELLHSHYRSLVKMLVDMDEWGQLAALRILPYYARRCFPQRRSKAAKKSKLLQANSHGNDTFYDSDSATAAQGDLDPDLKLLFKSVQPLLQSHSSAVVMAVTRLYLSLANYGVNEQPSSYIQSTVGPLTALLRCSSEIVSAALPHILHIMSLYPQLFVRYTRHFLIHCTDTLEMALSKLEALSLIFPHASRHAQSLIMAELTHSAHSSDATTVRSSVAALGRCAKSCEPSSVTSRRCLRLLLANTSGTTQSLQPSEADGVISGLVAAEALTQIRHLIQANPTAHRDTIIRLAKDLDTTVYPAARATIVWLVGEFATTEDDNSDGGGDNTGRRKGLGSISADVLRILAKGFADEDEMVKKQILLLSTKVYLTWLNGRKSSDDDNPNKASNNDSNKPSKGTGAPTHSNDMSDIETEPQQPRPSPTTPHPIPLLYTYIHSLIRYDTSYPLRDMARVHRALLPPLSTPYYPSSSEYPYPQNTPATAQPSSKDINTQLATLLFQCPKPVPKSTSLLQTPPSASLCSATQILQPDDINSMNPNQTTLPDWVQPGHEPDPRLRDSAYDDGRIPGQIRSTTTPSSSTSASARLGAVAVEGGAAGTQSGAGKATGGGKTLDDWLDESSETEEEEEEEGGEEGSSEEETESEDQVEEEEEEETDSVSEDDSEEDERGKLIRG